MRPDPSDLLAGVQRLLAQEIVPALAGTPYLQEQATMACVLLEHCRNLWPRLHLVVTAEHDDLRRTLERLAPVVAAAGDAALAALAQEFGATLDRDRSVATDRPLTDVLESDRGLRELVSRATRLLGEPVTGESVERRTARDVISAYLCRFAAREADLVSALGLGW
jgi:hypothetical protein